MEKSNIIIPLFLILQNFTSPVLSMDKECGVASSASSKKPLHLKCDQSIGPQNFEKMINEHPDHPLIKVSTEFLSKKESNEGAHVHTDTQHNKNITSLGLSPHIGSRVNNVIPSTEFEGLQKNLPCTFPMNGRMINFLNLYQLKTGDRKGQYLGANIFNFSDVLSTKNNQQYIATEAPYDKFDYYRMVIDCNAAILVSLTTDKDDSEAGAFPKLRNGLSVVLHHLKKDEIIDVDGYEVKVTEERVKHLGSQTDILIKTLVISKGEEKRELHHIIYKNWLDGSLGSSAEALASLLLTIHHSEKILGSKDTNPLVVNCGYGYGRTGILILMHQLSKMLPTDVNLYDLSKITVDINPLLTVIESNIAQGSPIGIYNTEQEIAKLKLLMESIIAILVRQ
ncbi:protein-tyrosine phosphatase family protein [Candidatus Odyssella acanthamoebae]|uniref:Tyrosine specific protein phosphatases domain-containing protein n=1 Tax=Candidatus Odyssella acanthamoebae TaxID=91604 RepID=A0A077ATY2_9PROT|nr:protein-tyrosine phosphatase family protein [Candidatus Paracaedibacter acanthamoebae]AIK96657.1 hypothetical protein ID47_07890 [Candidatus Paracaedibacter acanthamoebae]